MSEEKTTAAETAETDSAQREILYIVTYRTIWRENSIKYTRVFLPSPTDIFI